MDDKPVVWDKEGDPPVPMVAGPAGIFPMRDSGRVLTEGEVIDEVKFREMAKA